MRVRLLGIAAGGGMPQWNCRCPHCDAARQGRTPPLAECCLAFSPDGLEWYLINATPDLSRQLARWPELHPTAGIRSTPLRGVILTDGELDHVLGLLHLREGLRWMLYATPVVAAMLERDLRILPALRRYAGVQVSTLSTEEPLHVGDGQSRIEVRFVDAGDRVPRYLETPREMSGGAVVAVLLRDLTTRKRVAYAPAVGYLSPGLRAALEDADVILFDGTFWAGDELRGLGIHGDHARGMGHIPVGGPDGSAHWLAAMPARTKLYVHVNNTNPLLDPASPERLQIRRLGLDVASEGWGATL